MTKEEKQLLLKDLCARLPYGVVLVDDNGDRMLLDYKGTIANRRFTEVLSDAIEEYQIRPYLRPMSSMTEEEVLIETWLREYGSAEDYIDFCLSHHIDYRRSPMGLSMIERGLAIEAPEGMYKV